LVESIEGGGGYSVTRIKTKMTIAKKIEAIEAIFQRTWNNPFEAGTHTYMETITLSFSSDGQPRRELVITDLATGVEFDADAQWQDHIDEYERSHPSEQEYILRFTDAKP